MQYASAIGYFLTTGLGNGLQVADLQPLEDVYSMLCDLTSPLFIWSYAPRQVVACIVDHELIGSATNYTQVPFTQSILEHLLIGLCAGCHGSTCSRVKSACRQANVCPSVFALRYLSTPNVLEFNTDPRLPDICSAFGLGQVASLPVVDAAIAACVFALFLVPYNGEANYLAWYFHDFDSSNANHLTHLCIVHGMQGVASLSNRSKRAVLTAHMLGAGCLHNISRPLLTMPAGCLEVVAEL